ncbi:UNVERIFIED_CONTAM: hypothetical protein HDU68_003635 [Siphonaria sp. JEL0065]|nr:hypothetical protein HDU68_003635 [Siphonaria sp. JEL0065]
MQPEIANLATEIIQQILLHLPIDDNLQNVGLASKTLFAPSILASRFFALTHYNFQKDIQDQERHKYELTLSEKERVPHICHFLLFSPVLEYDYLPCLPFNYQLVTYTKCIKYGFCSIQKLRPWLGSELTHSRVTKLVQEDKVALQYKYVMFELASAFKHTSIVMHLYNCGHASIDLVLHYAITGGFVEIIQQLLSDPSLDLAKACLSSIHRGYLGTLQDNLFPYYSWPNSVEIMKLLLLDGRVDPTYDGNYQLGNALLQAQCDFVHLLVSDSRVNPADARVTVALHSLCQDQYLGNMEKLETVKVLLDNGRVERAVVLEGIRRATDAGNKALALLLLNYC